MSEMRLFDDDGNRLNLNQEEHGAFLAAASKFDPQQCAFGEMLAFTGYRISETLELGPPRFDLGGEQVTLRSLKKRREDVYRAVPVPPAYMDRLQRTFSLRQAQKRRNANSTRLWPWSRTHGWRIIKAIMDEAEIPPGPQQLPKGLRHAHGIHSILSGVPVTQVQKSLGHADLSTTSIYLQFGGEEAAELAVRMWN